MLAQEWTILTKDVYVDRTVLKKYKISDIADAVFAPGYEKVEY